MSQTSLSALIWSTADLLRGDYKQSSATETPTLKK